jgi:flavin-dependent dehydrogenase
MSSGGSSSYDIAVIGGGPAGATVAALLAMRGRSVVLFEKTPHPRFHIGESLLPKNVPIFERLGVLDQVRAIGMYKPGAEFIAEDHPERQNFLFSEALDPNPHYSFQVRRSQFDEILLRNAAAKGAEVLERCTVTDIAFGPAEQRIAYERDGTRNTCVAKFVIDASGRDGFLAGRMKLRSRNKDHNSAAMFGHFKDVPAEAWTTPGNIGIYLFEHGWMWMIPLADGTTSVGAVCMPDHLKSRRGPLDEFYFHTLKMCPKIWTSLEKATLVSPVRGAGNYSYTTERAFGDGYLLLGDAYAFVDPVFSSGVFIAMSSAELAAVAVDEALKRPERAERLFRAYQREVDKGIRRFSWLIYRFNAPAMRKLIMGSRNVFGLRSAVISLVTGDVYSKNAGGWRLALFRTIYHVLSLSDYSRNSGWASRRRGFLSVSVAEDEVAERS